MTLVVLLSLVAASGASGLRWLRVAQREHYLPGSAVRFTLRWWSSDAINIILIAVLAFSLLATFVAGFAGLGVAIVLGLGPFGLGLKGATSSLAWTQRLKRLCGLAMGLYVVCVGVSFLIFPGTTRLGVTALIGLCVPVLVDLACVIAEPLESRKMQPFIDQASARLAAVAPRVVAITGSYGKTSTKNHLADLLSGSCSVVPSPRSFNNRAGLARAINEQLVEGTQVFIAEMGTYGPGEIAELCSWCPPDVSILTAIGPVHLERFGSLEVTLKSKAEITERASVVVLNVDDQLLASLIPHLQAQGKRVITASAEQPSAEIALVPRGDHEFELIVRGRSLGSTALPEGLQPSNVACAVGAALELGLDPAELVGKMRRLPAVANRLALGVAPSGVRVIDDTFNSNPAGATAALQLLREQSVSGRKVVVTPGMIELGPRQREENEKFAAHCAEIADLLIIVRRSNRSALRRGAEGSSGCELRFEDSRDEAVAWVREHLREGDCVLYENDLPDNYP